jgi:hemoglobin
MGNHDIRNEADIKLMVDSFYAKITTTSSLAHVFNDIANVDWSHHLPRMYDFWCFLALDMDTYRGNPIEPHHRLHEKFPLKPEHFEEWVTQFKATVDEHFEGEVAEKVKFKAWSIAETWKYKFAMMGGK